MLKPHWLLENLVVESEGDACTSGKIACEMLCSQSHSHMWCCIECRSWCVVVCGCQTIMELSLCNHYVPLKSLTAFWFYQGKNKISFGYELELQLVLTKPLLEALLQKCKLSVWGEESHQVQQQDSVASLSVLLCESNYYYCLQNFQVNFSFSHVMAPRKTLVKNDPII